LLDANTFSNQNVAQKLNENFINIKIDAETKYGQQLFANFSGTGYPLILFLDSDKSEIDRFYGYYETDKFINKLDEILKGENIFPNLLKRYELGDNSAETMSKLAKKYADRGEDSLAVGLYKLVVDSKDVSLDMFHEAKYFINTKLLWGGKIDYMKAYLNKYPGSPYIQDGVYQLLAYFKNSGDTENELLYFDNYLNKFSNDPWFLNQYSWRMTEINQNLELALEKANLALTLLEKDAQGIANIIDTKAEVLWKLGKIDEAIQTIEEALMIDPNNEYFQIQKEKFIESSNL
tara:strand:+ start:255 stop:1127 length:873 start_codon:yes stop_codon:yes gene_type:complete